MSLTPKQMEQQMYMLENRISEGLKAGNYGDNVPPFSSFQRPGDLRKWMEWSRLDQSPRNQPYEEKSVEPEFYNYGAGDKPNRFHDPIESEIHGDVRRQYPNLQIDKDWHDLKALQNAYIAMTDGKGSYSPDTRIAAFYYQGYRSPTTTNKGGTPGANNILDTVYNISDKQNTHLDPAWGMPRYMKDMIDRNNYMKHNPSNWELLDKKNRHYYRDHETGMSANKQFYLNKFMDENPEGYLEYQRQSDEKWKKYWHFAVNNPEAFDKDPTLIPYDKNDYYTGVGDRSTAFSRGLVDHKSLMKDFTKGKLEVKLTEDPRDTTLPIDEEPGDLEDTIKPTKLDEGVKVEGGNMSSVPFMSKPETSTAVFDNKQKEILSSSLQELGRRRTDILEGLDFTLSQLEDDDEQGGFV